MDNQPAKIFPNLLPSNHIKTSDQDGNYNCIAWAAGRGASDKEWWWPGPEEDGYVWPPSVPRENTPECFVAAFQTLGYEPCESGEREAGWQKLALYIDHRGEPTHMARQLEDGRWTSKLGEDIDITHDTVEVLEDSDTDRSLYGKVAYFLRCKNPDF